MRHANDSVVYDCGRRPSSCDTAVFSDADVCFPGPDSGIADHVYRVIAAAEDSNEFADFVLAYPGITARFGVMIPEPRVGKGHSEQELVLVVAAGRRDIPSSLFIVDSHVRVLG